MPSPSLRPQQWRQRTVSTNALFASLVLVVAAGWMHSLPSAFAYENACNVCNCYAFTVERCDPMLDYIPLNIPAAATELDFSDTMITSIDSSSFGASILGSVRKLRIANAQLANLPVNTFSHLPNLELLDLSDNQWLTIFPSGALQSNTNLKELRLAQTGISSLQSNSLSVFPLLKVVQLSYLQITTLPTGLLSGLSQLEELYLDSIDISVIPPGFFDSNTQLTVLDISYSKLTTVPTTQLNVLANLELLYLQNNDLTAIPPGVFSQLASLEILFPRVRGFCCERICLQSKRFSPIGIVRSVDGILRVQGVNCFGNVSRYGFCAIGNVSRYVSSASAASAASVTSAQSVTSVQSSASVASVALVSSASAASVASAASANSLISVDFVVSVDSVVSVASVRSIGGGSTTATPAPSAVQSPTHVLSSARDGSSAASVASSSSASLALPPQSDQASSSSSAIVGAAVGIVLLVLIAVVAFVLYRRHKRRLQPFGSRISLQKSDSTLVPMQAVGFPSSQSQSQSEVYASPNQVESAYATVGQRVYSNDPPKPSPEYAYATSPGRIYSDIVTETTSLRQGLVLGAKLGSGAFGVVLRGQLPSNLVPKDAKYLLADERQPHLDVAVKTIPSDADPKSRREFIEEARMMARFDNPNVVRAICSLLEAEPLLCVLELMPFGDLRGVLQKSIKVQVSWTRAESAHALAQVARGLDYLEQIRFVHRDIAARNCLVGANLAVKISDFGLSRAIAEESDYYRMETKGRLPVKWMAPECLLYRKFTHQSDVWAFGVLAWEVYSYGASPYGNQKGPEILAQVEGGFRLQKPAGCADVDFEQVFNCWNREPLSRPSFAALSAYFAQVALNTPVRDIGLLVSS
ncbi:TKL protein kinase [Capsaspora owczarzaki ATCC 30864]|uniref:TKL protein kinase n=1 Tax=Capsaspora owczarzaki (strain ATCC 30864) TaxID=595528 RepID=A0A0D2VYS7_CAPO3|nr:TKL protein kinase [Capsaspora owczarzaki ATCC 30864]